MGIFPNAQGQLTLQSDLVKFRTCPKLYGCPHYLQKMKKIRSNIETLESSQHYISIFIKFARADNSGVGGGIWPKFELVQAFMHVLLSCKNEVDQIKNEGARVFTRFSPL